MPNAKLRCPSCSCGAPQDATTYALSQHQMTLGGQGPGPLARSASPRYFVTDQLAGGHNGRPPQTPEAATSRERLRATFDTAAKSYHQARPDYPEQLYEELLALAGLRAGDRLLEVGAATGKATLPLARRGLAITALEIGAGLAAQARRNLAPFPAVEVVEADFETWSPPPGESFGLVFAATAWHWIDPAVGFRHAWELLRPGGHLAIWRQEHVFPDDGDPFFDSIQEVYEEIGEGLPPGAPRIRPGEIPGMAAEIEASGLFASIAVRNFDWEVRYDADGYIALLDTFSGHIDMTPAQRGRLYEEIRRRLAVRPGGTLRRHWGAVLDVAQRLDMPPR